MTKRKLHLTVLACVAAGLLAFLTGFTYSIVAAAGARFPAAPVQVTQQDPGASAEPAPKTPEPGRAQVQPLEMFDAVYQLVHEHFRLAGTDQWEKGKRDQALFHAGLDGMLRSLKDPYTYFLSPDDYKYMLEQNQGHFDGIGAYLQRALDGKHILLGPIVGGPAARAGLKLGDVLLKINNVDAVGMAVDKAKDLIRGPAGTPVTLTVGRAPDSSKPFGPENPLKPVKIVVERAQIKTDELEYRVGPPNGHEKEDDVGYILLKQFQMETGEDLDRALSAFSKRKVKGIVLDLRNNPGGLLDSAIDVASRFIEGGAVVIIQESGGQRNARNADRGRYQRPSRPLVVLVNGSSASASEIVAGALHDHGVAKIVGETTFGKGLVQTIVPLEDGAAGALKITTQRYFTPKGTDVNHKGIKPDVEVEGAGSQDDNWPADVHGPRSVKDPQLDRALEILREQIGGGTHVAAGKKG
ncbi:MAG: S41 family peptidase [Armatimonadetes bacterium]|nr:S41 family peptidase [Armatimonadota bacterium]